MYMKRKDIKRCLGIGLCAVLLAGCGKAAGQEAVEVPELIEPVDVTSEEAVIERRDVYVVNYYESAVLPEITELCFEISGTVREVRVAIGDVVREGDVLAVMNKSVDSNYYSLLNQLMSLRSSYTGSNRTQEIEIERGRLTGKNMDREELLLRQQKEIQEMEELHLIAQIEDALVAQGETKIVAPYDGVIVGLASGAGSNVSETTPVVAIANENDYYLSCPFISEKTINESHDYYANINGRRYELEYLPIDRAELEAMTVSGVTPTTKFRIKADKDVKVGDFAVICMVTDYRENVVAVPRTALYKDHGNYYIYLIEGENRIQTPVTLGVYGAMFVEVLSGVEEGARVYVKE